ncbi:hypothetical protein CC1G_04517 [Coprinopsis cinerea okayama7|uniref:F-box domain-containing protein n=1 Tax=Coprinopsis cinerea (strain Okayama-7 / 130 / ATCC MYA-4618 / FGSC 9003) TaxID=240176 RepID=A8N5D9_COPC7|nr:hypothetical protein CC1G_04517 [Coprinopsis cinerea okayama7\|eukprot:XP_001830084.2 hypothetical protein CC1G_04517 [Coprinopsis cinerea okayama7\
MLPFADLEQDELRDLLGTQVIVDFPFNVQGPIPYPLHFPSELVVEVFMHILTPFTQDCAQRHRFKTLRCVCRHWREVAFSTAKLWSKITLDSSDWNNRKKVLLVGARMRGWFDRAKASPLSLYIQNAPFCLSHVYPIITEDRNWSDIHISFARRYRYHVDMSSLLDGLRDAPYHPWRNLQALYMHYRTGSLHSGTPAYPCLHPVDQHLPNLESLDTTSLILSRIAFTPGTILHPTLTTFKIILCRPQEIKWCIEKIVPNLPALETLVLEQSYFNANERLPGEDWGYESDREMSGPDFPERIQHPKIRHFTLVYGYLTTLRFFTLPALRILKLVGASRCYDFNPGLENFFSLLTRSGCRLEELDISHLHLHGSLLSLFLRRLDERVRTLSSLSFHSANFNNHLLHDLSSSDPDLVKPLAFPMLKRLELNILGSGRRLPLQDFIKWFHLRKAAQKIPTDSQSDDGGREEPSVFRLVFRAQSGITVDRAFIKQRMEDLWDIEKEALSQMPKLGIRVFVEGIDLYEFAFEGGWLTG